MDILYSIFADPFVQMVSLPDFFIQVLWEGLVAGVLYSLIALGFVLIFKASGIFNFALRAKVRDGQVVLWHWHEDSFAISQAYHG